MLPGCACLCVCSRHPRHHHHRRRPRHPPHASFENGVDRTRAGVPSTLLPQQPLARHSHSAAWSSAGMGKKDDPKLMQEWFKLVQEKNALVRYESELMIL